MTATRGREPVYDLQNDLLKAHATKLGARWIEHPTWNFSPWKICCQLRHCRRFISLRFGKFMSRNNGKMVLGKNLALN